MARDRNQRKPNRADLAPTEWLQFLEAALASVPDGIIIVDATGRIVFVNEAGQRLLPPAFSSETPAEELVAAFKPRYPDGRPMPPGEMPLDRALRGETMIDFEFVASRPGDSDVYISAAVSPLRDERGGVIGAVATFHDITRRAVAEQERARLLEQLNTINQQLVATGLRAQELAEVAQRRADELETTIASIADAVFVSDRSGCIVDANEAALRLLGLTSKREALRPIADYVHRIALRHPDGRPIVKVEEMALSQALRGETVRDYEEVARDLRTGHDINLLASAAPIRDSKGAIVGAVVVLSDITRIKEADRLKDEFIAVAAHELKTPVAIMKGYAQALLRGKADIAQPQRRMLEAINRGSDRIDRIVKDLLDISRLHIGHLELHTTEIDLSTLVDEVVERMASTTTNHLICVIKGQSVIVQGDRDYIEQVLVNLLDNAIRYSPEGGDVNVQVYAHGDDAIVSVRDRGVGIPKGKQAGIFQPFFRAHTGTPYDYGGMGVGLYISREIVSLHGGQMWFESEEGKGSTFYFTLPLRGKRGDK